MEASAPRSVPLENGEQTPPERRNPEPDPSPHGNSAPAYGWTDHAPAPRLGALSVIEARCLRLAVIASILASAIGVCVLTGWVLGNRTLQAVLPGLVTMKPNTAICILLAGVSLLLTTRPQPSALLRRIAFGLAGVVALLGALTAVEYLTGYRFGIDELFFKDPTSSGAPGRMAPITAANAICLGGALIYLRSAQRQTFAMALAAIPVFTSVFAVVGLIYGVGDLYEAGAFSAVALHTSIAMLLLSAGIWCAGSRVGFMRLVTDEHTSGMLVRRFGPAALVVPFVIGWLRFQGVRYGLFGSDAGVLVVAMANAMSCVTLVWVGARFVSRSERRQMEALKRFREVGNAMPQIVWGADADGEVNYYNDRWYEYTGLPRDPDGSSPWRDVLPADDLARVTRERTAGVAARRGYEVECRIRRGRDGELRWYLARGVPIKDADGSVLRWIGTSTDIHESKLLREQHTQLLDSERAARLEAERINHMKDEFLATLSHELRTPLNAILGWGQLLQGDPTNSADVESGLATIERSARSQKAIIDDLLDMSSMISGKVRIDVQRVNLASVLEAAVETIRPAAEAKAIRLQTVLDPQGCNISGDPNRLQQVFWNLLINAVKFTPKGGRVHIVLERNHSHLEVTVTDTGSGIAPEFLPNVFDRFRQADSSSTRQHGGLGLGLAIVKQLVELHGGSVHVSSAGLGHGTSFRIMLPVVALQVDPSLLEEGRRHPLSDGGAPPPYFPIELAGVRVLVVDDEADARGLIKRLLEDRGAVVRVAGSAAEAMELMQIETPAVLVSDIGMPGEDGYALIRQIRALPSEAGGNVPAIALTAYARAEDRMKAVRAGFQMHVSKPVEPAELLTMVGSLAGRMS